MCKSLDDHDCPCAHIDGCTSQCLRESDEYMEKKREAEEIHISEEILKEDSLSAARGRIDDLERENNFLREQNSNLTNDLRSTEMKSAELEKKLNTRKKLWGFSWENVFKPPFVVSIILCSVGLIASYCTGNDCAVTATTFAFFGGTCLMIACLYLLSSWYHFDLKLPGIVNGALGIVLATFMLVGFGKIINVGEKRVAISQRVTEITDSIQSPEALLQKAQAEKEKLEQELKDAKEELKKKQTFH